MRDEKLNPAVWISISCYADAERILSQMYSDETDTTLDM